ncbi:MAG TPA: hypothetical protein VN155_07105 [Devosia sp.]|nr:hypothetical protein [Devosia sp.]
MLNGRTILIVEEEFLIALDIQRVLEDHDAGQCVFARSAAEALALSERWHTYSLAIVELRPDHADSIALLRGLSQAGTNLIVTTSDPGLRSGSDVAPGAPTLIKPFPEEELLSAIGKTLSAAQNE